MKKACLLDLCYVWVKYEVLVDNYTKVFETSVGFILTAVNKMSSSVGRWLDCVILNWLGPTSITSVLSELRSRKLFIQDFTSCRQVSILGKQHIYVRFLWIACLYQNRASTDKCTPSHKQALLNAQARTRGPISILKLNYSHCKKPKPNGMK